MPRVKTIPDADVFATVRQLLAEGGDKAVAFGSVARVTGLAAPTLVQRYGSRDEMVRQALLNAWDTLDAATERAAAEAADGSKGALALLKLLSGEGGDVDATTLAADFRDAALRDRAETWRSRVESLLAERLGGGSKAREAAAMLFAAWQGQRLWAVAGGKGFRLKDAVKRLG